MPPKPKYSREEILDIAFDLVREKCADALTARELADRLGTSSRPIFTAFESMNELKSAVVKKCEDMFLRYCDEERMSGKYPEYKALGMAYIRLAKQEKNVFKLLFMRDRSLEEAGPSDMYTNAVATVQAQTGLGNEKANTMHVEMWIWVHGIAAMSATSYLDLDYDLISDMLTDVYTSLQRRHANE